MDRKRRLFVLLAFKKMQRRKRNLFRQRQAAFILHWLLQNNTIDPDIISLLCCLLPAAGRHWMTEYDQNWFKLMWKNRYHEVYIDS